MLDHPFNCLCRFFILFRGRGFTHFFAVCHFFDLMTVRPYFVQPQFVVPFGGDRDFNNIGTCPFGHGAFNLFLANALPHVCFHVYLHVQRADGPIRAESKEDLYLVIVGGCDFAGLCFGFGLCLSMSLSFGLFCQFLCLEHRLRFSW